MSVVVVYLILVILLTFFVVVICFIHLFIFKIFNWRMIALECCWFLLYNNETVISIDIAPPS